ncbi:hypothetical protein SAMN05216564_102103 [Halopenitus persicus]|uniref:Uncharacterized protein n=1 Tax=Halopenitus persicus TaxID=1048396 RepID=A0A1H3FL95_9EURY|nr:hypothetical protein SAMN05216564_102103 [Halopenitus persicus]
MGFPTWIRYRGFVVALLGFAITRFFAAGCSWSRLRRHA